MSNMPDMPDTSTISLLAKDQYFREMQFLEGFTQEEETKYLERVVRGSLERLKPTPNQWVLSLARDARDRLVECYQPLVIRIATRYQRRFQHYQLMDIVQEVNIGLLRAFDEYAKCYQNYPFVAVARTAMTRAIWSALYRGETEFAMSDEAINHLEKVRKAEGRLYKALGRYPSTEELLQAVNLSAQQVENVRAWRARGNVTSLQACMEMEDGDEYERADFENFFTSGTQPVEEAHSEVRQVLNQAMEVALTPQQKKVLGLCFQWDESKPAACSPTEIAEQAEARIDVVSTTRRVALENLREVLHLCISDGRQIACELDPAYASEESYTLAELAERIGCDRSILVRWATRGRLPVKLRKNPRNGIYEYVIAKSALDSLTLPTPRKNRSYDLPSIVA